MELLRKILLSDAYSPDRSPCKGLTILVAEDDTMCYQYLETILFNEGMTLLRANNGKSAVQMIHENPSISLVLMDISMPVMDGLEATREIRQFNTVIPIIAHTAHMFPDYHNEAIIAGCDVYLNKPVSRLNLVKTILKYTERILS